jgi:hypothetical protein
MTFRKMQITEAHTRKRQDAIAAAKTQGGLFARTGSSTYNGDDVFVLVERQNLKADLNRFMKKKSRSQIKQNKRKRLNLFCKKKNVPCGRLEGFDFLEDGQALSFKNRYI